MLLIEQIKDGGTWYAETRVTDALIVEPWNAFSSLAIAAPALYFLWKIRKQPKQYLFLILCIPLLLLNGLGSMLFHGLRSSSFFLYMDFIPALLLTTLITFYLWWKALPKWWMSFVALTPVFLLRLGWLGIPVGVNFSYIVGGIAFLFPTLLLERKYGFKRIPQVILAMIFFISAIYFRLVDKEFTHVIPFGTHFLWHICSGIGAFLLADYLYYFRNTELQQGLEKRRI